MDREQEEMQLLGIFGICKEAYKIVFSWIKIFSQITFTLILPLSFIFLAQRELSNILISKIVHNKIALRGTNTTSPQHEKLSDVISSERAIYYLIKAVYLTLSLIFSLLSTSAVVYTIACIYTAREITFQKVMSVVPKVWKRVMVTFLSTFLAFFCYNMVAFVVLVVVLVIWALSSGSTDGRWAIIGSLALFYYIGFVYMTLLWQLASVVSVLEDARGFKAMAKSKALLKGKMWAATIIQFTLVALAVGLQYAFQWLVVRKSSFGAADRIVYGVVCLLLLLKLTLFGLVIHTVLYFVCKSYHHENIDKLALSDHLEAYVGDYVPLKAKDFQLGEVYV